MSIIHKYNKRVYDHVTEVWTNILGNNFHFGYFDREHCSLEYATTRLIDELAGLGSFTYKKKVLDIGCGIGTPAIYLYKKFGCKIFGISTSRQGIALARVHTVKEAISADVRFLIADGTKTRLPENNFDIVWIMESSHLMSNKEKLFCECFRLLKKRGILLLCDIVKINERTQISYTLRLMRYLNKLYKIMAAFGIVILDTPRNYRLMLQKAGFVNIFSKNVSEETSSTPQAWIKKCVANRNAILAKFSLKEYNNFINACRATYFFIKRKYIGYYLFKAVKE